MADKSADTLAAINAAGLLEKLSGIIAGHLVDASNTAASDKLKAVIDKHGLKHPQTMKLVATMQGQKLITPNLYQDLVGLQASLDNSQLVAAGTPSTETVVKEEVTPTPPQEKPMADAQSPQAVPTQTASVIDVDHLELTDTQKQRLRERLEKDREKLVKKLQERAEKLAQKMKDRADRGAIKKGMDPEKARQLKILKEKRIALVADIKVKRKSIEELKTEIRKLNPPKEKALTPEQAAKKAARDAERAQRMAEREAKKAARIAAKEEKKLARKKVSEEKRAVKKAAKAAAKAQAQAQADA